MPASTSSKTSVAPDASFATASRPSITRDPPRPGPLPHARLRAAGRVAPRRAALAMLRPRGDRTAVLAFQPVDDRQALFDGLEFGSVGSYRVERFDISPQLCRDVVGLERDRPR